MKSGLDWSFLVPISTVPSVAVAYLVPLTAAAIWTAARVYRCFADQRAERRPRKQVWWTLPIMLWAFTAAVRNIGAFEVLVESYSKALFISVYLAFAEAIVSLCLVLLVQLPGLLAYVRSRADEVTPLWSLGTVSALASVVLVHLFSVSVCAVPLLESVSQAATGGSLANPDPPASVLVGCYDLKLSPWRPVMMLGEDRVFVTPPDRIELTSTKSEWNVAGFVVQPAPGAKPSVHRWSYWEPLAGGKIRIVWTTGFSGLRMTLKVTDSGLTGKATTSWDFPRKQQTAEVLGIRSDCACP